MKLEKSPLTEEQESTLRAFLEDILVKQDKVAFYIFSDWIKEQGYEDTIKSGYSRTFLEFLQLDGFCRNGSEFVGNYVNYFKKYVREDI